MSPDPRVLVAFSGSHQVFELTKGIAADDGVIATLRQARNEGRFLAYVMDPDQQCLLHVESSTFGFDMESSELTGDPIGADWRELAGAAGSHVASRGKVDELFKLLQAYRDIPWTYKEDCCYARASFMRELIRSQGFDCSKIYAQSHPDGYLRPRGTKIRWSYHIAPLMAVGSGAEELLVLDPSLFSGAVPMAEWMLKFSYPDQPKFSALAHAIGSPTWYVPRRSLFEKTADELAGYQLGDSDFFLEGSFLWIDFGQPFERQLGSSEHVKERMLEHWSKLGLKNALQKLRSESNLTERDSERHVR